MRSIPVDVAAFTGFACVMTGEPKVINQATGEVRVDRLTGGTVYVVGVVAMRGKDSSVIQVSVVGEPQGLVVGSPVRVVGLEAAPWERDGRSGVAWRATAVLPLGASAAETPAGRRAPGGSGASESGGAA